MIFALDPGTKVSTAVLFQPQGNIGRVIEIHRDRPNEAMEDLVEAVVGRHQAEVVVEDFENYGNDVPMGYDCITTVRWSGRFWERAESVGGSVFWVKRTAVKLHLCGSRRAQDKHIRVAIVDRYGGEQAAKGRKANPGPLFGVASHSWSALAVALTWADMRGASE